ncbi:4'-phosphopantetheinyl transferase superfamily protein [Massilia sp. R2A-15]|uniref:4'-phosphopantetheinyl transferase family protein n=1 Tax=Massilia sp. R2A-15 TaxID=3064278 RepID=UPI0027373D01|nr:4'-phosphopantetheinyl transferase superfamily protein [Massilia sp. R2A-15]WLI91600.1 4'-phosphopantetheinyl transferase superfamily protein [Massilia sp. R2A-15]
MHAWPGPLPAWEDGLIVICTAGGPRDEARARIRDAVRAVLGGAVEVVSAPGSAPQVMADGVATTIGLSISHEDGISVAALHRDGAVGVDVMKVQLPSDWARVAHDYLGMSVAVRLAAVSAEARPFAFAQAWAQREAQFKLMGESLAEWSPLPDCRLLELDLPPGFAGALALPA